MHFPLSILFSTRMCDRFQALAIYRVLRPPFPSFYRPFSSTAPLNIKKRMPPKKAAAQEKKILLGRPGNNLKIGIVGLFSALLCAVLVLTSIPGLPNVGKSSFFNALSETGKCPNALQNRQELTIVGLPMTFQLSLERHLDLGKAANFPYATINPEGRIRILFKTQCQIHIHSPPLLSISLKIS